MKEKIPFKEYPTIHRIMLPAWYGVVALCAVLTAYAVKKNKNIKEPVCALATSAIGTTLYHVAARNEARQAKQRD